MLPVLIFFGLIAVLVSIAYIMTDENEGDMYVLRCIKCSVPNKHTFYGRGICEKCLRKELRNNDE